MNDQRRPNQAPPPATSPPATHAPPDKRPDETVFDWAQRKIAGTFSSVEDAAERLRLAGKYCHLVGGTSVCPLKIGHEIAITVLEIDPNTLYDTKTSEGAPRKKGIGGSTLMQIAAAAGVEWTELKRIDDQRDVHVAKFRAIGRYPSIDGTFRQVGPDDADSDFRDKSPALAVKKEGEIPYLRANIVKSTATKAQLRALRKTFGIPHSMTLEELEKPYVFSRMIWTGRDANPEIQLLFAKVEAHKQLMAHAALYGMSMSDIVPQGAQIGAPAPAPALTAAVTPPLAKTPTGHAIDAEFADEADRDDREAGGEDAPVPMAPVPTSSGPTGAGSAARPRAPGDVFMPGKKGSAGKVKDATDKDLAYWRTRLADELETGKVADQYVENTRTKLEAIIAEMALRERKGEVLEPAGRGTKPATAPNGQATLPMTDAQRAAAIDRGDDNPHADAGSDDSYGAT